MRMSGGDYSGVEIPIVEFGYWAGTIRRWSNEGLNIISPVPEDISDDSAMHEVLNAVEDMRIDRKNFDILPNIKEFYAEEHDFYRFKGDLHAQNGMLQNFTSEWVSYLRHCSQLLSNC